MRYLLEMGTDTVHLENCKKIQGDTVVWSELFFRLIGIGKYKKSFCKTCCKKLYFQYLRKRNAENVAKAGGKFVAIKDGKIFHRPTCHLALNSPNLRYYETYKGATKENRQPCKVCTPSLEKKAEKTFLKKKELTKKQMERAFYSEQGYTRGEIRAIERHKEAQVEKEKIFSQTEFAFWAARGYATFHLRNCLKLKGLTQIKGFQKYEKAVSAGYTPCKLCKPTKKMDVECAIPVFSKKRDGESEDVLEELCIKHGYEYKKDEQFFYFSTPKGKWKIRFGAYPIRLEHINLLYQSQEYHRQPKMFYSYSDAFYYIKRHDES